MDTLFCQREKYGILVNHAISESEHNFDLEELVFQSGQKGFGRSALVDAVDDA